MNAIEVKNLTKIYRMYDSPRNRLRELVSLNGKKYHHEFHALNDVSLNIEKGQTVGIIGHNGSGKSTLLKMICGVLQPTSGSFQVNGRIAALLELGAGFNPEFSGRANVYMNGALMGVSQEEMDRRISDIEAFADIGEFIDQPIKAFSSGMYVRLAFAAAVNIDPEILIVDEALAVGDILFQSRCFAKFKEFKKKGVTIIFVTHALDLITTHCDRALLIDQGNLIMQGLPKQVVDEYNKLITSKIKIHVTSKNGDHPRGISPQTAPSKKNEWQHIFRVNPDENRYGTGKAEILEAGVFSASHEPVQILERNQEYLIKVKVRHNENMPAANIGFNIRDPKGTLLCGTNMYHQEVEIGDVKKGEVILATFKQKILINPGEYLLCLATGGFVDGDVEVFDRRWDYLAIRIVGGQFRSGLFDPESVIEWTRLS